MCGSSVLSRISPESTPTACSRRQPGPCRPERRGCGAARLLPFIRLGPRLHHRDAPQSRPESGTRTCSAPSVSSIRAAGRPSKQRLYYGLALCGRSYARLGVTGGMGTGGWMTWVMMFCNWSSPTQREWKSDPLYSSSDLDAWPRSTPFTTLPSLLLKVELHQGRTGLLGDYPQQTIS